MSPFVPTLREAGERLLKIRQEVGSRPTGLLRDLYDELEKALLEEHAIFLPITLLFDAYDTPLGTRSHNALLKIEEWHKDSQVLEATKTPL